MSNRVRLHAPPTDARLVDGSSQEALDRCAERVAQRGHAVGLAGAATSTRDSAVAALDRANEALETARAELLDDVVHDTAWLATEIARQVLRIELDEGRYDLQAVVRDVLEASGAGRSTCTVHLHPEDVRALEGVRFRAGTTIEEDVEVERGDVHVTTRRGLMVRELEATIGAIRDALLDRSK